MCASFIQVFDQTTTYEDAQSKIGSNDNAGHMAGGGQTKARARDLLSSIIITFDIAVTSNFYSQIFSEKLTFRENAQSKLPK